MKYFGHESDAGDDPKLKRLVFQYGMEGSGVYWRVCELIAKQIKPGKDDCILEETVEELAPGMPVGIPPKADPGKLREILDFMASKACDPLGRSGLLTKTKRGQYQNLKLKKRADEYTKKRLRGEKTGGE